MSHCSLSQIITHGVPNMIKFESQKRTLKLIKGLLLLGFTCIPILISAQSKPKNSVDLEKIPPRIIRACCAFGYDLKLWGVPFVNIDQVISVDDLGVHHYLGHKNEGTGIVYTHKGGFIDMGHVRDQIDWTRYLFTTISNSKGKGEVILHLPNEAGRKTLYLNVPALFDNTDCILLAGKITYDLSLWHEISTWFGARTLPLLSEKFSSFSVEDVYSNLLGVHVGMKTLHSKIPFNTAATMHIKAALDSLEVVETIQETYEAYDAVNSKWYTNEKRIPHTLITLKRDADVLTSSRPWIVPGQTGNLGNPIVLDVPLLNGKGELLTDFYKLAINLNYRFPVEEIFPMHQNSLIDQDDFGVLLHIISDEVQIMEQNRMAEP